MRRAVRIGLVVLGAAMAVYGAASLTGGWLGTPPWAVTTQALIERPDLWPPYMRGPETIGLFPAEWFVQAEVPRRGREWISGGVVAAGLALVAVGAWPRRWKAVP